MILSVRLKYNKNSFYHSFQIKILSSLNIWAIVFNFEEDIGYNHIFFLKKIIINFGFFI
jgi:hypothetical protein